MKIKDILGLGIGVLGTTYFAGKVVDSVKKIMAKDAPLVEEKTEETATEEPAEVAE